MNILATITLLMSFAGVVFGDTFYKCYWIAEPTVDCSHFASEPICGTDLVTYTNKCEFSKAHCKDNNIDLRHIGACTDADKPTTATTVAGGDVVFDFMCTALSHKTCPTDGTKVCGSDGRPYANVCEYEKAKCTHRDIHVVDCTV